MVNKKQMTTLQSVKIITLKKFEEKGGSLFPLDFNENLPFKPKRIYYVINKNTKIKRGCHSHKTTKQILICLSGSVKVTCKDGSNERDFLLNDPSVGLFIPNNIWDEVEYQDNQSILLVISSTHYDRNDYIENWQNYTQK
jgi:dTDP-4-dehydrorhamnose 3,5-epimerase-like enzyme